MTQTFDLQTTLTLKDDEVILDIYDGEDIIETRRQSINIEVIKQFLKSHNSIMTHQYMRIYKSRDLVTFQVDGLYAYVPIHQINLNLF